ncbi:MAG TPA: serine/threonine-protein kinase [Micromonosporaceae bacterium]|nr:serine/threonine-protein kinase [Micromonosporaceae bacterium]
MTGTHTLVAGRYRLRHPLGRGGMGTVWLATDEVLHRDVAVKEMVPPPGLSTEERASLHRRSRREARAAARLNHPNVVRVYDIVDSGDAPWIVMEYVPARSLHEVIRQDGPLSPARVATIGLAVLEALRAAHHAGVMHRDVKPGNVLLADNGRIVLTDFGLATVPDEATVTRVGLVLGSPSFIPPERARGEPGGPWSDMWSLGATLFAAVEGHAPFERASAMATLTALATEPVPPTRRAGPLHPVLEGLLHKDPAQRLGAADADRMLREVARGPVTRVPAPSRTRPVPPVVPQPSTRRRRKMPLVLAVLALVAVAIAVNALLPRDTPPDGQGTFGSTPTTGPTAQAPTANAPTGEKTTEEGLPQGWRTYRDETGFAVAVPIGWTVVRRNGIVYFDEPNGGRLLGIDQTDQPKSDPVADWEQQEAARLSAGDFPRYERIGIRTCDYFVACADWEFRYTSRGTRVHVNNRGVVVSDNRAYGFWWSTPDSQWTASLSYLDVIFRTFQPAR